MSIYTDYNTASSVQIIKDLGRKFESVRLSRNITQEHLAQDAGVSKKTISRLENGEVPTLDTVVRVMRALGLTSHLEALLPNPEIRPIERVKLSGHERLRARTGKKVEPEKPFKWGDETGAA
jgi:transcriptional regulator with XRE-family HTH domain